MIRLSGICVGPKEKPALDNISLELAPGACCGLIGPPHAGKTVLLKVLAGLIVPRTGELSRQGSRLDHNDESMLAQWQKNIGMSFQNDALFDSMSVFENVAFPLRRRGFSESDIQEKVSARLNDVGLLAAKQKFPGDLSGGMRKRVGIARATIADPRVGLFDEPTAGLDPITSQRTLDLVVAQATRLKAPAVIVGNDLPVLFPVCDRVMMLVEGSLVFDGSVEAIAKSGIPVVRQFLEGSGDGPL